MEECVRCVEETSNMCRRLVTRLVQETELNICDKYTDDDSYFQINVR